MGQTIFIPREADAMETCVATSPDTMKGLAAFGFDIIVEASAGTLSRITDDEFSKAGALIGKAGDAAKADVTAFSMEFMPRITARSRWTCCPVRPTSPATGR